MSIAGESDDKIKKVAEQKRERSETEQENNFCFSVPLFILVSLYFLGMKKID